MYSRIRKAVAMWFGQRSVEEVQQEIRATHEFENAATYRPYWGFRAMLGALSGNAEEANIIHKLGTAPKAFDWWLHAHLAMTRDDSDRALEQAQVLHKWR